MSAFLIFILGFFVLFCHCSFCFLRNCRLCLKANRFSQSTVGFFIRLDPFGLAKEFLLEELQHHHHFVRFQLLFTPSTFIISFCCQKKLHYFIQTLLLSPYRLSLIEPFCFQGDFSSRNLFYLFWFCSRQHFFELEDQIYLLPVRQDQLSFSSQIFSKILNASLHLIGFESFC